MTTRQRKRDESEAGKEADLADQGVVLKEKKEKPEAGSGRSPASDNKKANNDGAKADFVLTVLFTVLGVVTRFYSLPHPAEVVFDEQHFGRFTNYYLKGEYFFDIHPPLGKLVLMIAGLLSNYDGHHPFGYQGEPYPTNFYVFLRAAPALFGALLVPLVYITCRVMRFSRASSALVGWMVLCENILITESKFVLTDSFLFFFDVLSVCLSFKANQYRALGPKWKAWMLLCGISMGCAVSVKFTAIGVVGTIGVHQFLVLIQLSDRPLKIVAKDYIVRAALLLVPIVVIFFGLFALHLYLLPFHGDGDAFMTSEFLARLSDKPGAVEAIHSQYEGFKQLSMWPSIKELINTMHASNIGLRATHPFSSTWDLWPLAIGKPVLYWQQLRSPYGMWLYCVGNVASWWIVFFYAVVGFVLISLTVSLKIIADALSGRDEISKIRPVEEDSSEGQEQQVKTVPLAIKREITFMDCLEESFVSLFIPASILWVGYIANLVPYCLIPRATWNYHYIPALLFGYLLVGAVSELILRAMHRFDFVAFTTTKFVFAIFFGVVTACFIFFAPWTYGFPMSDSQNSDRFLFAEWSRYT